MSNIINLYIKYKEIINYLIFGVFTTLVSLGTYYLFTLTILDANDVLELQIANILAWVISVLFAYITNRKFVFSSNNTNIFREIRNFFGSRIITLVMDMLIMFIGVSLFKVNDMIIKIISQVVVIVGNYLFSKLFVFGKNSRE